MAKLKILMKNANTTLRYLSTQIIHRCHPLGSTTLSVSWYFRQTYSTSISCLCRLLNLSGRLNQHCVYRPIVKNSTPLFPYLYVQSLYCLGYSALIALEYKPNDGWVCMHESSDCHFQFLSLATLSVLSTLNLYLRLKQASRADHGLLLNHYRFFENPQAQLW